MSTTIEVTMPGNLRVEAKVGDFVVGTDQAKSSGGDGTAPEPFTLFVCSLATCAGYYAMQFCRTRDIATDDLILRVVFDWEQEIKRAPKIQFDLQLPTGFPEKYRSAILRAMDQCSVKRHIVEPPEFEVSLS